MECPVCYNKEISLIYETTNVPVHSCLLKKTREDSLKIPHGDIKLGICKNCGFIYNMAFKTDLIDYTSIYEDQQCFSPTFNKFATNLAKKLIKKHDIHNKKILEIAYCRPLKIAYLVFHLHTPLRLFGR
jgi:hypothetical protein